VRDGRDGADTDDDEYVDGVDTDCKEVVSSEDGRIVTGMIGTDGLMERGGGNGGGGDGFLASAVSGSSSPSETKVKQ
jgi:hypothetical protein